MSGSQPAGAPTRRNGQIERAGSRKRTIWTLSRAARPRHPRLLSRPGAHCQLATKNCKTEVFARKPRTWAVTRSTVSSNTRASTKAGLGPLAVASLASRQLRAPGGDQSLQNQRFGWSRRVRRRRAGSSHGRDAKRRVLRGRLPNAREDPGAASLWTDVVPAGVLAAAASGAAAGPESATLVSGDDVDVCNTCSHGLQSTLAGV